MSVPAEPAAIEAATAPRFAIPLPPQIAVLAAALALGFGGVIGSALSPGIETILASAAVPAAPAEDVVASTEAGGGGGTGGSGGSGGASSSGSSTASTSASTSTVAPAPITTAPVTEPVTEEEAAPTDDGASSDDGSSADEDPTPGDGTTIATGTVVRVNPEAESYSLASGAAVSTIHAEDLPAAGTSVEVPTVNLFNGTLSEEGERKESGEEEAATLSGTVTYVDEDESLYVLSAAGASIPVRVSAQGGKVELPPLSALITVDVEIGPAAKVEPGETEPADPGDADPGADPTVEDPIEPATCEAQEPFPAEPVDPEIELTQTSFTVDFDELSTASLEGIVQATCPELDQVVVSADDLRELGEDLVLATPKEVDPAAVEPGESVTVNANPTPSEDGTLELSGLADDDGLKGADDDEAGQGDKAARVAKSLRLSLRRLFR